ncbi:MAG: bifunctional metallophosphatase/5'-nucleotidase [Erysipelotrichaceae bacterium]
MSVITLDILSHADFHGHFRQDEDYPGLSRLYCAIEEIRKNNPQYTLLLDAGDNTNKTLWQANQVFDGLKLLGTDCFVLGNHEFDKGRAVLLDNVKYASQLFPVLCCNVLDRNTNELIENCQPYTMITKGKLKIGIVGATTQYADKIVEQQAFSDFMIADTVNRIRQYVLRLKKMGADIIIVLSHFPFYFKNGLSGELADCLDQLKDLPIDVFIGGHIPGDYCQLYQTIAVCKAGFGGVSLAHVKLDYDTELKKVVSSKCAIIDVLHDCHKEDEKINEFIAEVVAPYNSFYQKPLAIALDDIKMRLAYESAMGDLIADAVREHFKVDFAYFNTTSCGREIRKGVITRYSIHKAIAFNETIQLAKFDYNRIYQLFTTVLEEERFGNNANIFFSGLKVIYNCDSKELKIMQSDGKELDKTKQYTVATSKYMSTGGNDTKEVVKDMVWKDSLVKMHDILAQYLEAKQEIYPEIDNRYSIIGNLPNDNSPW